jgi:hypothetical protein
MRHLLKLFSNIALIAVIGFEVLGCDNGIGSGGDANGNDSGNQKTYMVTVINGTGSGDYKKGETIEITANTPPQGQQFKNWTANQ